MNDRRRAAPWLAWILAAGLPACVAAETKELKQISAHLKDGNAGEAQKICAALPRRMYDVAARLPYGTSRPPDPGAHADLFARCAVAALRAGDAALASWRWHAAHAFDPKVAASSAATLGALDGLPAVRRAGQGLPPLMVGESKDWHEAERWIADAPRPGWQPAPLPIGPQRDRAKLSLRGGFKCKFVLEAILGREGRLREPTLLSAEQCVTTQVTVLLDALGERGFEPARSESGEPIDVTYRLQLGDFTKSTSPGPSKP